MSLPTDFIQKYQRLLASQAPEFLTSLAQAPTAGFRLNPQKAQLEQVNEDLSQPITEVSNGYRGKIDGHSIDHLAGWIYSQDPSAMNVAQVAQPQAHERVLDLCAAPGGKTTQLAALMHNQGLLIANEINHSRARVLSSNVERWGLTQTVVTNNSPAQLAAIFPHFFDCIVVDAPCSGEGLFRKDPTAMQYWSLDLVQQCAQRQQEILISAMQMLAPQGRIIYSTCTFAPEEDEQIIAWLLDNYPLTVQDLPRPAGVDSGRPEWGNQQMELKKAWRLFPQHYAGEGHFICALQCTETASSYQSSQEPYHRSNWPDQQLWQDFEQQTLQNISWPQLLRQQDNLYCPALNPETLASSKVLRNGLKLGTFKKKRFEPDHALVLALRPDQFQQVFDLNSSQFQHFVHGEALILTQNLPKGWIAVSYQNKIFAWGKVVQNQLKNFLPKGLRQP
ncbi:RsmF rRNA methyltransferase first C-terminal domain-containing protein [Lactobacillus sp. DCY120]|uniref:RsmF rRNA methyltransferase first C-terminal domain-containing protein n=1 Tax=Bombilactobacillus apium TaxID=2675299 RepID=A0A850R4Q7_9LACO|nr:RsmB/NOP family class I SAM-dependent RNA methyltransferase [Bombilactobacillus apium]NVY95827.1 RsmF rRNA methyltransferase first C-terminal domain-containing protein [Bombilactobacillus apium]